MNRVLKKSMYIIFPLIGIMLGYLLMAFFQMETNVSEWSKFSRVGMSVISFIFSIFGFFIADDIINHTFIILSRRPSDKSDKSEE